MNYRIPPRQRQLILPSRPIPGFGITGSFEWATPPARRIERIRALAASRLGIARTAVFVGMSHAEVTRLLDGGGLS
ncbi:MAG TPA: hypothetical protein VHW25_12675 [Steroidobacteraceae bacterium]|jgi:hypothetical protein|nr:hypothetical protein [Steroidobacteraceae bacterium]